MELLLIAFLFVDLINGGGQMGRQAAALFFGGAYTAEFWALVIVTGLLVPLFLEIHQLRHKVHAGLVAPILLLVGGFALRWILVSA